jgi:hypothetical protein
VAAGAPPPAPAPAPFAPRAGNVFRAEEGSTSQRIERCFPDVRIPEAERERLEALDRKFEERMQALLEEHRKDTQKALREFLETKQIEELKGHDGRWEAKPFQNTFPQPKR